MATRTTLDFCPCCGFSSWDADSCLECKWESHWIPPELVDASGEPFTLREAQEHHRQFGYAIDWLGLKPIPLDEFEKRLRGRGLEKNPEHIEHAPPFHGDSLWDPDLPFADAPCACCGYFTITGGLQRCSICGWVCSTDNFLHDRVFYNAVRLPIARHNFLKYGAVYKELADFLPRPSADIRRDPSWELMTEGILTEVPGRYWPHIVFANLTCQCCGHRSLLQRGACVICGWNMFTCHRDPSDHSQRCPIKLRQMQENFRKHGKYWMGLDVWGQPVAPDEVAREDLKDPDWRPLD